MIMRVAVYLGVCAEAAAGMEHMAEHPDVMDEEPGA
jgi:hypothetical protein